MSVTREELTRVQKQVINFYKKQIKEVKDQLKEVGPEDITSLQRKVNLLNSVRLLDYDLNNILTAKTMREFMIREKDIDQRHSIQEIRTELEVLKMELRGDK